MKVFRISGRDVGNPVGAVATLVGASMKVFRISGRDLAAQVAHGLLHGASMKVFRISGRDLITSRIFG